MCLCVGRRRGTVPGGLGFGGGAGARIVVRMPPPPMCAPMDGSERRRRRGGGTTGFFLGLRWRGGKFTGGCAGGTGGVREEAMEEARRAWLCVLALAVAAVREVEDEPLGFRDRGLPATSSGPDEVVERAVGCRDGVVGGTDGVSVFRTATVGTESLPDLGTGGWGIDGSVRSLGA